MYNLREWVWGRDRASIQNDGTPVKPFSLPVVAGKSVLLVYSGWFLSNRAAQHSHLLAWGILSVSAGGVILWVVWALGIWTLRGQPVRTSLPVFSSKAAWTGLLLLVIAFHVRVMLVERVEVRGESMEPSLLDRETVWIDKIHTGIELPDLSFPFGPLSRTGKVPQFGAAGVERGDIIVFRYPGHAPLGEYFVKRVIALPGDHYSIDDGKITLNGTALAEPYLREGTRTEPRIEDSGAGLIGMPEELALLTPEVRYSAINGADPEGVVPPHTVFVLGDNRAVSKDSRSVGFIPTFYILGIVRGR